MTLLPDARTPDLEPPPTCVRASGPLTPRQFQVLTLLIEGFTPKQIAALTHVNTGVIRYHLRLARDRLGARNNEQAVARALAAGYVVAPPYPRET